METEPSSTIGETILNNTRPPTAEDPGMAGGSIKTLVNLFDVILKKHEAEETDEEVRLSDQE